MGIKIATMLSMALAIAFSAGLYRTAPNDTNGFLGLLFLFGGVLSMFSIFVLGPLLLISQKNERDRVRFYRDNDGCDTT